MWEKKTLANNILIVTSLNSCKFYDFSRLMDRIKETSDWISGKKIYLKKFDLYIQNKCTEINKEWNNKLKIYDYSPYMPMKNGFLDDHKFALTKNGNIIVLDPKFFRMKIEFYMMLQEFKEEKDTKPTLSEVSKSFDYLKEEEEINLKTSLKNKNQKNLKNTKVKKYIDKLERDKHKIKHKKRSENLLREQKFKFFKNNNDNYLSSFFDNQENCNFFCKKKEYINSYKSGNIIRKESFYFQLSSCGCPIYDCYGNYCYYWWE